jgi:formylglycine-generating enzyme required for sulfatase activity
MPNRSFTPPVNKLAILIGLGLMLWTFNVAAQLIPETARVFSQGSDSSVTDLASQAEQDDQVGQSMAAGDFNADGYLDLAIGVPFEDRGPSAGQVPDTGWTHVVYGGPGGLNARRDEIWDQTDAVQGAVEARDENGFSVTAGDFNGDGFDDLAWGSPGEAIGSEDRAGAINVVYGSAPGLSVDGNQQFHQDSAGIGGVSEPGDELGFSIAAGDFNNDGFDDIAFGAPREDLGSVNSAGLVQILYGSAGGLTVASSLSLDRNDAGMGGVGVEDWFGEALAVGDFNGDQYADLAVGAPLDQRSAVNAGTVHLVYGGPNGLDLSTNQIWALDSPGIDRTPAQSDNFGASLTAGDFDDDGIDDLVVGLPGHISRSGAILVIPGSGLGLDGTGHQFIRPGLSEFAGFPATEVVFGSSLSAGDINADGADDLIVGSRLGDPAGQANAGAVMIAFGETDIGLVADGSLFWDRSGLGNSPGSVGELAAGDLFGTAALLADFDNDGRADAVISSPGRRVSSIVRAGDLIVVYSSDALFSDRFEPDAPFQDCDDCPLMVKIPAGSFVQGSPSGEPQRQDDEGPQRTVNVPAFAIGQTEVTFSQWDACVSDGGCNHSPNDFGWGRADRPVVDVSWDDVQDYLAWLRNRTGKNYRLSTESEWEYATRAGTASRFNTGDCIISDQGNFRASAPAQDCPAGADRQQTLPVASFAPNAFGLYDTHGNASEWVQDCWNESYSGAPVDGSAWTTGNCGTAVFRSGSWANAGDALRSAKRARSSRDFRSATVGFRVARFAAP